MGFAPQYSGMGDWNDKMLSDKEAWEVVTFLSRLNSLPATMGAAWHSNQQPCPGETIRSPMANTKRI
jgi:hypothetical protein